MFNVDRLYQQTILEYNNRKDLKREIPNADFVERGHNPSCGDDISLFLQMDEEKIKDASYMGSACAICTASTAMLIDNIKDKSINEAKDILKNFFVMMRHEGDFDEKLLNDAVLMEYVSNMPARVKCATLAWHTMKTIIEGE